ncbi:hypothetical protein [Tenacibaculum sp. SG-28]|uniref:hypothetical protein n=1 Tax=Tenacibaculum sp. SG-28 TaxID=754426 RepID=UPI000CF4AE49|nr:hypothetical protein [Tenacibaculum sp. SG-28]PQJ22986.1 hypothetical protein BSU00_01540 [Tenacibaculum sp. SG-28]
MKKILYAFAITTATFLASCSEDFDRTPIIPDIENTLTGTVEAGIAASGRTIEYTVTIPSAFDQDARIGVKSFIPDNIDVTDDNTDYSFVFLPAGQTSGTGTISLAESAGGTFGVNGNVGYGKLQIDGVAFGTIVTAADGSESFTFDPNDRTGMTSDVFNLTYYDSVQFDYGADVIDGRMTMLADWANPDINDLDMYVFNDDTGVTYEVSESANRYETDIMNNEWPDGNYIVQIGFWIATDNEIPWRLFFVHPNQITIDSFSGTFSSDDITTGFANVVTFEKTTDPGEDGIVGTDDDGEVSYVFRQL